MLWSKAWLETRTRFLISFAGLTALAARMMYGHAKDALPTSGISYYYFVLNNSHQLLTLLWIIALTLLMMGGLVREKAAGASSFTLALPVSRRRLMWTRIAAGLAETIVLAVVPWVVMYFIVCTVGRPIPLEHAAFHVVLMLVGGVVFFAFATLVSSVFEGEYTAPLVAFGIAAAIAFASNEPPLRSYSPWYLMFVNPLIDRKTELIIAPLPWLTLATFVAIAAALLFASVKIVERREF
jgi:ABC-2 type transport system permease protein